MSIYVNDNDTLKEITEAYVNDNGTLRDINEVYVNDNGTLRDIPLVTIGILKANWNVDPTATSGTYSLNGFYHSPGMGFGTLETPNGGGTSNHDDLIDLPEFTAIYALTSNLVSGQARLLVEFSWSSDPNPSGNNFPVKSLKVAGDYGNGYEVVTIPIPATTPRFTNAAPLTANAPGTFIKDNEYKVWATLR